jgi:hypothetical protein
MEFLRKKLSDSQTRDFVIRKVEFSSDADKENKTRIVTLTEVEIECIFKGLRPRSIDYEAYKDIRKILKAELKSYLKGERIHLSKVSDEVWNNYVKDMVHKPLQKGHTYKKENEETSDSGDKDSK